MLADRRHRVSRRAEARTHRKVGDPHVVIDSMVEPSPCPRCGGPRAWMAGTGAGATLPVNCGGCGREAHACPRCGWEWTGLPRGHRASHRGVCISCQVLDLAAQRPRHAVAVAEIDEPPPAFASAFDNNTRPRSRLLQRLADSTERTAETRYRCYRLFADVAGRASRRADAVARLEAQLRAAQ